MTGVALLLALNTAARVVMIVWIWSGLLLAVSDLFKAGRPEWCRDLFHELRPFYLPAVLARNAYLATTAGTGGLFWFNAAVDVVCYFIYRNVDKDDRWKRRRDELGAFLRGRTTAQP